MKIIVAFLLSLSGFSLSAFAEDVYSDDPSEIRYIKVENRADSTIAFSLCNSTNEHCDPIGSRTYTRSELSKKRQEIVYDKTKKVVVDVVFAAVLASSTAVIIPWMTGPAAAGAVGGAALGKTAVMVAVGSMLPAMINTLKDYLITDNWGQRQRAKGMLADDVLGDQHVKTQYIITDFAKHLKAMLATLDYQP